MYVVHGSGFGKLGKNVNVVMQLSIIFVTPLSEHLKDSHCGRADFLSAVFLALSKRN